MIFLAVLMMLATTHAEPDGQRVVAAGMAQVTAPPTPVAIELPADLVRLVTRRSFIFYFSPSCPHCQATAPEVVALAEETKGEINLVGVASGTQSAIAAREFANEYGFDLMLLYHDADRSAAAAMGVRTTPALLIVQPGKEGLMLERGFYPYHQGAAGLVRATISDNLWAGFKRGAYQSNTTCAGCHTIEHASWAATRHGAAYYTLVKSERQFDEACVPCHVTGESAATGFDAKFRPHLADVGCEACHGPGGPHDGEALDPTTVCQNCHDDKHALDFSLDRALPHIDHFIAESMSPEDLRERRLSIFKGTMPRALVGFASGETVGAAKCQGCHPIETENWRKKGHSTAMSLLSNDEQTKPECVRCHATQTSPGPFQADINLFRLDESVGCESCHGPGTEHIAQAGAPGTIQGLGESCPVCVIEALCTSCHTPDRDPDWDLERGLKNVHH